MHILYSCWKQWTSFSHLHGGYWIEIEYQGCCSQPSSPRLTALSLDSEDGQLPALSEERIATLT